MNKKLYQRWDSICAQLSAHIECFEEEAQAENKAMLFSDIERLTPLADNSDGQRDQVAFRQLRYRLPPSDICRSISNCLYGVIDSANDLQDQLEDFPMAHKVLTNLIKRAYLIINAIEAGNRAANYDEMSYPRFTCVP